MPKASNLVRHEAYVHIYIYDFRLQSTMLLKQNW